MKNVRIVLDLNEENLAELMKENDLKNFDELRGYLLAVLHGSGVSKESAVYDKVDVCKKTIKLNACMTRFERATYESRIETLELNNGLLEQENSALTDDNESLKKRNAELLRKVDILQARVNGFMNRFEYSITV